MILQHNFSNAPRSRYFCSISNIKADETFHGRCDRGLFSGSEVVDEVLLGYFYEAVMPADIAVQYYTMKTNGG